MRKGEWRRDPWPCSLTITTHPSACLLCYPLWTAPGSQQDADCSDPILFYRPFPRFIPSRESRHLSLALQNMSPSTVSVPFQICPLARKVDANICNFSNFVTHVLILAELALQHGISIIAQSSLLQYFYTLIIIIIYSYQLLSFYCIPGVVLGALHKL